MWKAEETLLAFVIKDPKFLEYVIDTSQMIFSANQVTGFDLDVTLGEAALAFLGKGVLKICSKFTGDHPCRNVILIKLLCNFSEITLWYGFSPVNLLHIFRKLFYKDSPGRLLLH